MPRRLEARRARSRVFPRAWVLEDRHAGLRPVAVDPQATSVRPKSAPVSRHQPERAQRRNERRPCRASAAPIQRPWLREWPLQFDRVSRRGADDAASNAERAFQTDTRSRALSVVREQARPKGTHPSSRPRHTTAADDAHAIETQCPIPSRSDRLGCSSRRNPLLTRSEAVYRDRLLLAGCRLRSSIAVVGSDEVLLVRFSPSHRAGSLGSFRRQLDRDVKVPSRRN